MPFLEKPGKKSKIRTTVPFGFGASSRALSVGSASLAAIGAGLALVFQISKKVTPRSAIFSPFGGCPSHRMIDFPLLSWPVTIRRGVPAMVNSSS